MEKGKLLLDRGSRLLFLILLLLTVVLFALFQGGFVSWFIFYVTVPFLLYSFVAFFIRERIVAVERTFEPNRVTVGDDVLVKVKISRRTRFPFIYVTIKEHSAFEKIAGQKAATQALVLLGWKRQLEWSYTLKEMPRGEHHFTQLEVTFHDFFGWVPQKITVFQEQTLVVYPSVQEIQYSPLKTYYQGSSMSQRQSLEKDTSLVTGVRNYQAGDRFSAIHWKSFAKSNVLYTKEFEDQKSQELLLLLDGTVSKHFDDAVELAASIIHTVVKKYGDVSLLSVGEQRVYFPRIQGGNQLEKVMYHLATVKAYQQSELPALLAKEQLISQGASLVIITTELTDEKLMALAKVVKQPCSCFVISEHASSVEALSKKSNISVYSIPKGSYQNVFAEVLRP